MTSQTPPMRLFALQIYTILLICGFFCTPAIAYGANTEVAAWIPWWSGNDGAKSAKTNISDLDTIHPFVFEVTDTGELKNKVDFGDTAWRNLFKSARAAKVEIIPTVSWFDGEAMDDVLGNKSNRTAHIEAIVEMVEDGNFDGVDVDYEGKLARTKDDFSLFLKELNQALGNRVLTCAIEARTPPDALYKDVPETIEYANDYAEINKYCDRVEIMAYDQQRADLKLNEQRRGLPYMPIADDDWVKKVLDLALEDIDANKIMLGVATYGRAWDVSVEEDWYRDYTKVATLNTPRIKELAKKYKVSTGRTAGGEAVISYFPSDSVWRKVDKSSTPKGTPKGFEAAAKALRFAGQKDTSLSVRFITWSDAVTMSGRLVTAEDYGLRGVAVFKVDGEEDAGIWKLF